MRRKHHKIGTLAPDLQGAVNDRLAKGETYEDVGAFLRDQGVRIGKSSVGRYGKEFAAQLEAAKQTKEMMRTLVSEVGMDPLEMEKGATKLSLHMMVEALVKAESLGDVDPLAVIKALGQITRSSAHVEQTSIQFRKEQAKKATEAAERVEKKLSGKVTPETLTYIRTELLGLGA